MLHLPNSALRPPMDVDRKSRLLSICFRSIFALPLLDALEKHTCLFLEPPNIQVQPALKPRGLSGRTSGSVFCVWQGGEHGLATPQAG